MRRALSGRPVAEGQPRQGDHGVATPVAEPGVAGDDGLAVRHCREWAGEQKAVRGQHELAHPRGGLDQVGLGRLGTGEERPLAPEHAPEGRVEVELRALTPGSRPGRPSVPGSTPGPRGRRTGGYRCCPGRAAPRRPARTVRYQPRAGAIFPPGAISLRQRPKGKPTRSSSPAGVLRGSMTGSKPPGWALPWWSRSLASRVMRRRSGRVSRNPSARRQAT